jgi:zinc protease
VDEALGKLFPFGTVSIDRLSFQRALDEIGAGESAGIDFSLRVLADQFDRGVELLADNELHPALPEDAFHIVQHQLAATIAGRLGSPDCLSTRARYAKRFFLRTIRAYLKRHPPRSKH